MDRRVVKASLEDDAIGKCAQPAVRCCAGLRHQRVSIFDAGKRPSASSDGADALAIVHASTCSVLGSCSSSSGLLHELRTEHMDV